MARVTIALSGGADSSALAVLAARHGTVRGAGLRALHVHHGLHAAADRWVEASETLARRLGIALLVRHVAVDPQEPSGPEAAARDARHAVFRTVLAEGDLLLLAHHLEDQAETVLLRLLRGTGVAGLGAMAPLQARAGGHVARPLLDVPRAALRDVLVREGVTWVEDPSNADDRFDRAYLRQHILPRLRVRWPGADRTLARAAEHARSATRLLMASVPASSTLSVHWLASLSAAQRHQAVRAWLARAGAPMPSAARLAEIDRQMLRAAPDRNPVVRFGHLAVRRYRDEIHLTPATLPVPAADAVWQFGDALDVPWGRVDVCRTEGHGLSLREVTTGRCEIRYRRGGEVCRIAMDGTGVRLKTVLQDMGLPPWARALLPLLYVNGELAVVPGRMTTAAFRAAPDEPGLLFHWRLPSGPESMT